ncbi:bifunctional allantoicase/(S)-ureidoglycine aminohydrolase [Aestuariibius sp. HNIBRBA575]|uniref:bifunctional allantoicase/(S)-ureidoglycine aminohydrolase n=1 Tax=Aestuariibius sp. HNIBRBA575 TaxID=3233343 RepID=UPI0034A1B3C2
MTYAFPLGGLPAQDVNPEGSAIFTDAYAVIPALTMRDIVTSLLPGWQDTRAWILARPMTGFAETFAQYAIELSPGGGSDTPEPDATAQAVLFVAKGHAQLNIDGQKHSLKPGSFAYLPAGITWSIQNTGQTPCGLHWLRKQYQAAPGLDAPDPVVLHDNDVPITMMPDTNGKWGTQRFLDPSDLRYDFHANIVTFQPGGRIPFAETHVMEHGLYVLQGTARYLLNTDWVDVGPGDFMWLRAFCPQACIATGDEPFRYLLYKDVNRHPKLSLT